MGVTSDGNRITVEGELSPPDGFRVLAAMHNMTSNRGYPDIILDFSNCSKAYPQQMIALCAQSQYYWKQGVDIELVPPSDEAFRRLFVNTNWAHLIDFRKFEESRYRGYTHAPTLRFMSARDQNHAVNKLLDVLLAALSQFSRDDIRAIEWVLNELTDNVINHSQSAVGGFVQVTNHRQRSQIEFIVCDWGIGIPASLRTTKRELRSDQEALDAAIREGVTRDKNIGQGNGLYGTWRITQKSDGKLVIASGHAQLTSSQGGMRIENQEIPLSGTLICARIGYSKKLDLGDTLVFQGRRHIPVEYIETHFSEDEAGNVMFDLKAEAEGFGSRSAGGRCEGS